MYNTPACLSIQSEVVWIVSKTEKTSATFHKLIWRLATLFHLRSEFILIANICKTQWLIALLTPREKNIDAVV